MANTPRSMKYPSQSTRKAIIEALKSVGQATVNQLAKMVGVKSITVRHHLNGLMAEGLIEQQEKRQTVGRPLHVYSLTEQAESLFPHQYHRLVERLLDQVKEKLPPETIQMLMNSLASSTENAGARVAIKRELTMTSVQRISSAGTR